MQWTHSWLFTKIKEKWPLPNHQYSVSLMLYYIVIAFHHLPVASREAMFKIQTWFTFNIRCIHWKPRYDKAKGILKNFLCDIICLQFDWNLLISSYFTNVPKDLLNFYIPFPSFVRKSNILSCNTSVQNVITTHCLYMKITLNLHILLYSSAWEFIYLNTQSKIGLHIVLSYVFVLEGSCWCVEFNFC